MTQPCSEKQILIEMQRAHADMAAKVGELAGVVKTDMEARNKRESEAMTREGKICDRIREHSKIIGACLLILSLLIYGGPHAALQAASKVSFP